MRMKKYLLFSLFVAICLVAFAKKKPKEPIDMQFIVTDCGTIHRIPANATEQQAADAIDNWSLIDCK